LSYKGEVNIRRLRMTQSAERRTLSAALVAIRQRRRLRRRVIAERMGMDVRTYLNFESGKGPMTYERLAGFATAAECDLAALLICHHLGDPDFAVQSADNKAVSIALAGLVDLAAARGGVISDLTSANLVSAFETARAWALAQPADAGPPSALLAPRQVECLKWVQAGKSSFAIGAILGISPHTVDDYLAKACTRLGVSTRVQAVSKAIKLGLLSP